MPEAIDMEGRRFGRWTVIRRFGTKVYKYDGESTRIPLWLCRCDCGTEAVVNGKNLRSWKSKSCGCINRERMREIHALKREAARCHGV